MCTLFISDSNLLSIWLEPRIISFDAVLKNSSIPALIKHVATNPMYSRLLEGSPKVSGGISIPSSMIYTVARMVGLICSIYNLMDQGRSSLCVTPGCWYHPNHYYYSSLAVLCPHTHTQNHQDKNFVLQIQNDSIKPTSTFLWEFVIPFFSPLRYFSLVVDHGTEK